MAESKLSDFMPIAVEKDFIRGEQFMGIVRTYLRSMVEMPFQVPPVNYNFPYNKVFLMAQPLEPIERSLISFKHHKGSHVYERSTNTEPMLMQEFNVGLKSENFIQTDELIVEGSSPFWIAENGYLAHSWQEQYSFNPALCRLAIVEATRDWSEKTALHS